MGWCPWWAKRRVLNEVGLASALEVDALLAELLRRALDMLAQFLHLVRRDAELVPKDFRRFESAGLQIAGD